MSVREELRELTRQRLLAAAESIFLRDGYTRATVGNIAAAGGVSRAAFYLHFADKGQAMLAVLRANLAGTPVYWREIDIALVGSDRGALRAALSGTLQWYATHGPLLRSVREAMATDPGLARQNGGSFARLADEMVGYLAAVRPADRDLAHVRLQLLIVQLDQVAFGLVVLGRSDIDREVMLDQITDIWRLVLPRIATSS